MPRKTPKCKHSEDDIQAYLRFLSIADHEIYQCRCGALIDYSDEKNYAPPFHSMSAKDLYNFFYDIRYGIIEARRKLDMSEFLANGNLPFSDSVDFVGDQHG